MSPEPNGYERMRIWQRYYAIVRDFRRIKAKRRRRERRANG